MIKRFCSFAIALTMVSGCATTGATGQSQEPSRLAAAEADVARMTGWLEGPWTSTALARADPAYLDIRTVNVRLWAADTTLTGSWFYTESARPDAPTTPYRQNVFNLVAQADGGIHAYQYRVREPARFAGSALRGVAPAALSMDDLIPIPGCTLYWRRDGADRFKGAMRPKACRNTFRGAAWMDGSSWLSATQLHTWDRGMSAQDTQVWGPTKAGYTFDRAAR